MFISMLRLGHFIYQISVVLGICLHTYVVVPFLFYFRMLIVILNPFINSCFLLLYYTCKFFHLNPNINFWHLIFHFTTLCNVSILHVCIELYSINIKYNIIWKRNLTFLLHTFKVLFSISFKVCIKSSKEILCVYIKNRILYIIRKRIRKHHG